MSSTLNCDEKNLTLRVPADLISTSVEKLRLEADDLFRTDLSAPPKWDTFILDLSAAKMVDSAGLNLVVSWLKRVQQRGSKMRVTYSDPNILRTFTFTRLDQHIELVKV